MTRDRIQELLKIIATNPQKSQTKFTIPDPIERQNLHNIEIFLSQALDLRLLIKELKLNVRAVENDHIVILSKPIPDERMRQDLDHQMLTIKNRSQVIRGRLDELGKVIEKEEHFTMLYRMKQIQHSSMLLDFSDIMHTYQLSQVDYRDRCKARIKRQLNITNMNLTDEQIEHLIESHTIPQGIMMDAQEVKQRLADVEARHNDILKLEKSLKELYELFMEMAILIENQGVQIDRIETLVSSAQEYTEQGKLNLLEAEKEQIKLNRRKNKLWVIMIVAILILCLALILYLALTF